MKRFTLVELMIVVAIVAVLAAIAIPAFYVMQLKAKRAEVPGNIEGINDAMFAYTIAFDLNTFALSASGPAGAPGKSLRAWTTGTNFDTIAWAPDGAVRATYAMDVVLSGVNCSTGSACIASALCAGATVNMDGDGAVNCGNERRDLHGAPLNPWLWLYGENVY